MDKPLLGLATSREMLQELKVRFEVSGYFTSEDECRSMLDNLPDEILSYRTVDSK